MELATLLISLATFAGIIVTSLICPKIRIKSISLDAYWLVALFGASLLLICQCVPFLDVAQGLWGTGAMNPLKILILFFSMTIISVFLDEAGLFTFLASYASKKAKNSQTLLFFIFYLLTAILTIFTSNDIVILTFTPFLCHFCKHAKINPIPYLIAEFAAANTYSMMLIIGNPTNIYLATSASISFLDYLKVMALPTLVAGAVQILILYFLFYKSLREPLSCNEEEHPVISKPDVYLGSAALLACLVAFILSNYLPFEMWLIALSSAGALLIGVLIIRLVTKKHWEYLGDTFKRLPYPLIPFVLSMFVVVLALTHQGIGQHIASFLNQFSPIWSYGVSSFLTANVINNIPMSILFSNLIVGLEPVAYSKAVYASIIGSNIGAFLTPLGALAGIMFSGLVQKHGVKLHFLKFCEYGAILAIPTLFSALLILEVIL